MKTQWYVVYFKTRSEKKIAEILTRRKIENYFPLGKVIENWSVEKKPAEQPLFENYLFVKTTEKQLVLVKKLPSVLSLVYWLGQPAVISDSEVNTIRRFLTDHVNVKVEKVTIGSEAVKKAGSALTEQDNSYKIDQDINIVLPSLGYRITAGVETSTVRIISPDTIIHKPGTAPVKLFNPVLNSF